MLTGHDSIHAGRTYKGHLETLTGAGDEGQGVVANLRILPELHIGVVEHVAAHVDVVEGLGAQNHAHIISSIEQRHHLEEEVRVGHLCEQQQGSACQ